MGADGELGPFGTACLFQCRARAEDVILSGHAAQMGYRVARAAIPYR